MDKEKIIKKLRDLVLSNKTVSERKREYDKTFKVNNLIKYFEVYHPKSKKIIGTFIVDEQGRCRIEQENGLLAIRKRLDGEWGIEAIVNGEYIDTRIALAENGIIKKNGLPPTKTDILEIKDRLNLKKYQTKKVIIEQGEVIDGFLIREIIE